MTKAATSLVKHNIAVHYSPVAKTCASLWVQTWDWESVPSLFVIMVKPKPKESEIARVERKRGRKETTTWSESHREPVLAAEASVSCECLMEDQDFGSDLLRNVRDRFRMLSDIFRLTCSHHMSCCDACDICMVLWCTLYPCVCQCCMLKNFQCLVRFFQAYMRRIASQDASQKCWCRVSDTRSPLLNVCKYTY